MADSIDLSICSAVSLEKPPSPGHLDQQSQQYVKPQVLNQEFWEFDAADSIFSLGTRALIAGRGEETEQAEGRTAWLHTRPVSISLTNQRAG